jgi:hypothetical protein
MMEIGTPPTRMCTAVSILRPKDEGLERVKPGSPATFGKVQCSLFEQTFGLLPGRALGRHWLWSQT